VRWASPLLLAVVLLAACSGGESNGQRLTRDQYAAKADAICSKYKAKADALGLPSTLDGVARVADQVLPLLANARRELRKLRPPQNEESTANAWLGEFDVTIGDVKKIRSAAKKNDRSAVRSAAQPALRHDEHANELAGQLGMTICNKG
jgi:hypothetical protein